MSADTYVRVSESDFDLAEEYQHLANSSKYGAVVTFCGLVRELVDDELTAMTLEHYPAMTRNALQVIIAQARKRWQLGPVRLIHRVGRLELNDQIVFVGVASAHRKDAFAAAQFIMDYLKNQAPFWKKEHTRAGSYWVAAKESDHRALKQWSE